MSIYNMDSIFQPKTVAVVGAGEREDSFGASIMNQLISRGFKGSVFPVNSKYRSICGDRAYRSILNIEEAVDLAVLAVPDKKIPGIIRDCVKARVRGAVVLSTGDRVEGKKRRALEEEIRHAAGKSGPRVIGPGCLGLFSGKSGLSVGFLGQTPAKGGLAFISQSGAVSTSILDIAGKELMGFRYAVSPGAMTDVDIGDLIDYFGADSKVTSIVIHMEHLTRIRKFMSAARHVSGTKPIVVLKAGRSRAGEDAVRARSGGVAGDDEVIDAAFERGGIVRVKTFEALFDCAELLARHPAPSKRKLAIVTNAGGPGIMAMDALSDYGGEPVTFSEETSAELSRILPGNRNFGNMVDMPGDASCETFRQAVQICTDAAEVEGLLVMFSPRTMTDPAETSRHLTDLLKDRKTLSLACWLGGPCVEACREVFNQAGIPTFDTPERAVRAFMNMVRYQENRRLSLEIPSRFPKRITFDEKKARSIIQHNLKKEPAWLSEHESNALSAAYGIQLNPALLTRKRDGTLTAGPHVFLRMGAVKDRDFGPVIHFGLGGDAADALEERNIALPPLNRLLARRLMEKTAAFRLLERYLHFPETGLSDVEETLIRLSRLVTDFPEIVRLDLYPVFADENGLFIRQAKILVAANPVQSPNHLVISSYPNQYEYRMDIEGAGEMFIRPIRPEDAPLLKELFHSLSPQSVYFRFFTPMKEMPHRMLVRFTQIDYDREIAMVAIQEAGTVEKMLGVARVISGADQTEAEFAVLVADSWQGKGIGAALLRRCLSIAQSRSITKIWGTVLPENTKMLALGKRLGFSIRSEPDGGEYTLSIEQG